jgi:diaminopimelate decarboxylase
MIGDRDPAIAGTGPAMGTLSSAPAEAPARERSEVRPRRVLSRNEILRAGKLGAIAPAELARRFGTPLYVYDLDVIDRQVSALREILPPQFELAYAVKANPALAIVNHLARLGVGADVASGGELALVERAGFEHDRIVMTGPGKRDPELVAAVTAGIRVITVESPGELERLEQIATTAGRRVPILLRAAVTGDANLEKVRLIGDEGAGKFGMDGRDLLASARRALASAHVDLLGLHAFGASNLLDVGALANHIESTVLTARRLAESTGFDLRLVDAGGGLGIPYEAEEPPLDLGALGRRLAAMTRRWEADPTLRGIGVLLEPGRFLVGPAGAYLARVIDRKSVNGSTVVILDGGVHHVLRPALVGQEHRVRLVGKPSPLAKPRPVTVAGPLCTGLDVLGAGVVMTPPDPGDLVAVLDVGAYGYTESMPWFLSHPVPPEVVVQRGRAALIRPRIDPESWLDIQRLPDFEEQASRPDPEGST